MAAAGSPSPILTAHLFEELDGRLLELLASLEADEWERQTIVPKWTVRQVAAHLLDTALRRLALVRDGHRPPAPAIGSGRDLVRWIDEVNAQGVQVLGRLSAPVLISLMELAARQLSVHLKSLDPFAPAPFPVSWAGERESANWFDTARELTERWHHQQQIRLAVDRPGIMTPRLYGPVLDCFMRGLPHAYRDVAARAGAVARISVAGDCGGTWLLRRGPDGWSLVGEADESDVVSAAALPQEVAWRVFTKGMSHADALAFTRIEGDARVGGAVLRMISIVG